MANEDAVVTKNAQNTFNRSPINGIQGKIICRIATLSEEGVGQGDEARGIMSLAGSASAYAYTTIGKFLAGHDADIKESYGTSLDGNTIGCSFIIFKTKKATITRMIKEIEMNRIDEITIDPKTPQLTKTYEIRVTARNRSGIFGEIMEILEPHATIITQRCSTVEPIRLGSGKEIAIAHIYLKIEIALDKAARIGTIVDRIREIEHDEFWDVEEPKEIEPRAMLSDMLARLEG